MELEEPFHVAYNNPIYFRGEFYCLGRKGSLAVFNPSNNTWRMLGKPEPIYAELNVFDDDHEGAKFCYLVELEGDLVSVFLCATRRSPHGCSSLTRRRWPGSGWRISAAQLCFWTTGRRSAWSRRKLGMATRSFSQGTPRTGSRRHTMIWRPRCTTRHSMG